jgi:hypothetical protein
VVLLPKSSEVSVLFSPSSKARSQAPAVERSERGVPPKRHTESTGSGRKAREQFCLPALQEHDAFLEDPPSLASAHSTGQCTPSQAVSPEGPLGQA